MAEEHLYHIERHDLSKNKSLKAWSAADEYLLKYLKNSIQPPFQLAIYNDRFGYLACHLHSHKPLLVITQKSQEKAIKANAANNNLSSPQLSNPIAPLEKNLAIALIKIPKSLALFQLFLEQIVHNSTNDLRLVCAFMTRHFSPKILDIANQYFEVVEQSKAFKKARLLTCSVKKNRNQQAPLNTLQFNNRIYKQYWGVFSAEHIDYGTQFFLSHIEVQASDHSVLDLASGNGVIGSEVHHLNPDAQIHLLDDSFLAVSSAKLNIQGDNIHHHYNNDLSIFNKETFDLIVSNPPFHFEYEIDVEIALQLFRDCFRCLQKGGNLQLVANKHLNYKVHLDQIFPTVQIIAQDKKFIIYKCTK